jgi:hypothetical protein
MDPTNGRDASDPEPDPKACRARLEERYGQVWDSFTLVRDFNIVRFADPLIVVVERRADGVRGTVEYQHDPRFYWGFKPE